MKVVGFSIFKGGTGKTTTTVNTAAALVKRGKRVLLVDLDQQASATRYLDLDPEGSPSLYDVFIGAKSAQAAIRQTRFGIDVRPSQLLLAAIEEALEPGDEQKLAGMLRPLKPQYDFILIDTPPGKAMLAFNGLAAADLIVIPASAERMAVDGVADLITHVQKIMWSKFALTHQELRALFTMYRATTSHSPAVVENARKIWRDNVLTVKIPPATLFSRSYDEKTPVSILDPQHSGAIAYDVFAQWLIDQDEKSLKQPRTTDFDPHAKNRTLKSSMEDLPVIEQPQQVQQADHVQAVALPDRAGRDIPEVPLSAAVKRKIKSRHAFEIYEDQVEALQQLALEDRMRGGTGSMSAMVRDAIDEYIAKVRLPTTRD